MITLQRGDIEAVINTQGGYIEELRDGETPILFPKTQLMNEAGEQKTRGGCHVCLPNFGPDGGTGLGQHGFGRIHEWTEVETTLNRTVLELKSTDRYEAMRAVLTYTLDPRSFSAELFVENTGGVPFRIAPGFHPYFAVKEGDTAVLVNDRTLELNDMDPVQFEVADMMIVKTSTHTIRITQENLNTWALWTDMLSNYVCVEPTLGGFIFEKPNFEGSKLITTDRSRKYSMTITW